ncbi:hypothetical protein AVEN_135448-1 [Araneus ventricosus]|uniref:Uncharacterized protein n=1 Tax=Araneus ventricosus TaxID=182803 RepID=A0A4Y2BEY0_ARAVE|nr:hypothetical protein AVEN_135448-1 [Araneus ventricosus]
MLISRYTLLNCVSKEGNCLIFYQIGLEIRGPKLVTSDFRFQWLRPKLKQGLLPCSTALAKNESPRKNAKEAKSGGRFLRIRVEKGPITFISVDLEFN